MLVGNKKDLRTDETDVEEHAQWKLQPTKVEHGHAMAKKIGAYEYLECSAKLNEGVRDVFETIVRAAVLQIRKRRKCTIL